MMNKKRTNSNPPKISKMEIVVSLIFGGVIFVLSSTNIGYVELTENRSIDLSLVPAIFAAMIGGFRVGIPLVFMWVFLVYTNEASNMQVYTFYGLLITKGTVIISAIYFYDYFKRKYFRSSLNVYRTLGSTIIVSNIVQGAVLYFNVSKGEEAQGLWYIARYSIIEITIEMAMTLLAMMLLIKHLRQVHILNGVKRKESKQKESKKGVKK